MIRFQTVIFQNFDRLKAQLTELASAVNGFKSEAVQLRVVDLVFQRFANGAEEEEEKPIGRVRPPRRSKRKSAEPAAKANGGRRGPRARAGEGAPATLDRLVQERYFRSKPRTLADIVQHCENQLARRFRQNEFSGKLARLVRSGTLTRKKNADGQYEYSQQ